MEAEVVYGNETAVQPGIQARGREAGQGAWRNRRIYTIQLAQELRHRWM